MNTYNNTTPDSFLPHSTPCCDYPFFEYLTKNIDNNEVVGSRLNAIKSYMINSGLVPYNDYFDKKTSEILKAIYFVFDYQVLRPRVLSKLKNEGLYNA